MTSIDVEFRRGGRFEWLFEFKVPRVPVVGETIRKDSLDYTVTKVEWEIVGVDGEEVLTACVFVDRPADEDI